jgi:hypothetical protein
MLWIRRFRRAGRCRRGTDGVHPAYDCSSMNVVSIWARWSLPE